MTVRRPVLDALLRLEFTGIKFGLDNIRTLTEALGHPQRAYLTAHVAGTNGKGSVTAMVDAALRAAGVRSARYTSPHLCDVTERFVIDGVPVSPEVLERTADRVLAVARDLLGRGSLQAEPTFFEVTTAVAFELFRDAAVQVAVCEVGLGGRLDATNVLTPAVTAITSIGYDHQQYLGSTLASIAGEKAGILKPGIPVVVGAVPEEALAPIVAIAKERGAPVLMASEGVDVADEGATPAGGRRIRLRTPAADYGRVDLALAGAHQAGNALVAVRMLELFERTGLRVPPDAVRAGLETVRWPGRLDSRTLPDGRRMLLDAAHNAEGAIALAQFLASSGGPRPALVFTAMRDKDVGAMLRPLAPHIDALVLTRASNPRCAEPEQLSAAAREAGVTCPIVLEADLNRALGIAWQRTETIVVAGSIFLLGDVLILLGGS